MNPLSVHLVLGCLLLFARQVPAGEDDAAALQGRWRVLSAKQNGSSFAKDKIEKMFVVIEQGEILVYIEGTASTQQAKFKLDPKKSPKQIDFIEPSRDNDWESGLLDHKLFRSWRLEGGKVVAADDKVEGIYKLEGDSLTFCWRTIKDKEILGDKVAQELKVRPSVFRSDLYYHQFLFVLKRIDK